MKVPPAPDTEPTIFNVLEPPYNVPAARVTTPVNVCVKPLPRLRLLPPLMVSPAPLTLPVNVAVPLVLVIETKPVVVKPAMLWAPVIPAIVTPPEPLVNVPAFIKSPSKVKRLAPGVNIAPLPIDVVPLMVVGWLRVTPAVLLIVRLFTVAGRPLPATCAAVPSYV